MFFDDYDSMYSDYKNLKYNRANLSDGEFRKYKAFTESFSLSPQATCVFISHRSTDKKEAVAIAKYLDECGISTYIDIKDTGLQSATSRKDSEKVVEHIQKALSVSTHILVLISDQTRESWWVPYEIGYAKNARKQIASLRLKKTEVQFPEYLDIEKKLDTIDDIKMYVSEMEEIVLESTRDFARKPSSDSLRKYVRS